jgi:16S rRNA C967 or C1407 C5-methylase (RsmB/RsmF family)
MNLELQKYGDEIAKKIEEGRYLKRNVTFRVNTIKSNNQKVEQILLENNIKFSKVSWYDSAYILENATESDLQELDIYKNGEIYLQSLSSMLPPLVLQPKEGRDILDMTAAPGGKTTEIAALTNNKANITACEMNAIRAERLKYNIEKQGASSAYVMVKDSRNIDDFFKFDQILLDAPCSGSGTEEFREGIIDKCTKAQEKLLRKALKILKSGCEMVYSTCSVLEKENEDIVKKVIKDFNAEIVPIELENMEDLPLLPTKIPGTLVVMPNKFYEGFYIAKIRKIK